MTASIKKLFNYLESKNAPATLSKDGKPRWSLKQVCAALELDEDQALELLEGLEERVEKQPTSTIDEPGVYQLAIESEIEEAKVFQEWLTKVCLPRIITTGSYVEN